MTRVVIIDTETTGIDPLSDKLVELAGIDLDSDFRFETLINPGRGIPPEAMAIHHITEPMVADAPDMSTAIQGFGDYLKQDPSPILVAHNAKFDRGMLRGWLPNATRWLCTLKCAQIIWPDAPGFSNQVLRYWLGLKPDLPDDLAPHRAMYDIICTREILRAQLVLHPLETLIDWSNKPTLLKKVTFGKHKGKTWDQVDAGYLRWCVNQQDINDDVKYTAQHYLGNKGGFRGR